MECEIVNETSLPSLPSITSEVLSMAMYIFVAVVLAYALVMWWFWWRKPPDGVLGQ